MPEGSDAGGPLRHFEEDVPPFRGEDVRHERRSIELPVVGLEAG